jgi:hypothetical protein
MFKITAKENLTDAENSQLRVPYFKEFTVA